MVRALSDGMELLGQQGDDSLGQVFAAQDSAGAPVVVRFVITDGAGLRRVRRERSVLTGLTSKYVVSWREVILDTADPEAPSVTFVAATPTVVSLREELVGGLRIDAGVAARIGADLALGLVALHAAGLVHGGISADLVYRDGEPGRGMTSPSARLAGAGIAGLAPGAVVSEAQDVAAVAALVRELAGGEEDPVFAGVLADLSDTEAGHSAREAATKLAAQATRLAASAAVVPAPAPASPVVPPSLVQAPVVEAPVVEAPVVEAPVVEPVEPVELIQPVEPADPVEPVVEPTARPVDEEPPQVDEPLVDSLTDSLAAESAPGPTAERVDPTESIAVPAPPVAGEPHDGRPQWLRELVAEDHPTAVSASLAEDRAEESEAATPDVFAEPDAVQAQPPEPEPAPEPQPEVDGGTAQAETETETPDVEESSPEAAVHGSGAPAETEADLSEIPNMTVPLEAPIQSDAVEPEAPPEPEAIEFKAGEPEGGGPATLTSPVAERQPEGPADADVPPVIPPVAHPHDAAQPTQMLPQEGRRSRAKIALVIALILALAAAAAAIILVANNGSSDKSSNAAAQTPTTVASGTSAATPSQPASDTAGAPSTAAAGPTQPDALSPQAQTSVSPAVAALALKASDISSHTKPLTGLTGLDFNSLLRAVYAYCDYYSPPANTRSDHVFVGYSTGVGINLYDDVATWSGTGAQNLVSGVRQTLSSCSVLSAQNGKGQVLGTYHISPAGPLAGLPDSQVGLLYQRVDQAEPAVQAVFVQVGNKVVTVLAQGRQPAQLGGPLDRAAKKALAHIPPAG